MLTELQPVLRPATILLPGAAQLPITLWQQLEQRDGETSGHCRRLSLYAVAMGEQLRLAESELGALRIGALVHDIGKLAIPASILQKRAALDAAERAIMQQHTILGERMCAPIAALRPAIAIVRHHHERWDGSGYPDHLAGEAIPLNARIVQLIDIFDALTSARPYKPAWSTAQAIAIMQREADRGWLDPRLFREFVRIQERCR
jgi:putative two-component system response regulator